MGSEKRPVASPQKSTAKKSLAPELTREAKKDTSKLTMLTSTVTVESEEEEDIDDNGVKLWLGKEVEWSPDLAAGLVKVGNRTNCYATLSASCIT